MEHNLWSSLKRGTINPVCQSSGTAPNVHAILQNRGCNNSPKSSRTLRNSRRISSTSETLPLTFLTTFVHQRVPPQQATITLRPQHPSPPVMVEALPGVGVEAASDRELCQAFPADPHNIFGSAKSYLNPPPPPEPTHYQVVIG